MSARGVDCLDAPVGEDGGAAVGDFVEDFTFPSPEATVGDSELSREARDLLKLLSPREAYFPSCWVLIGAMAKVLPRVKTEARKKSRDECKEEFDACQDSSFVSPNGSRPLPSV